MSKRILAPLDGSELAEQALPYVTLLAKGLGVPVDLLRIIESLPRAGLGDPARDTYRQRTLAQLKQEAEEYLADVASGLRGQGIEASTSVVEGEPASAINSAAEKRPETIIAMSTHGRSGITDWALGSITNKVLNATANLILIVRHRVGSPGSVVNLSTVIVPLDGSELAEQILPQLTELARDMKIKVDLVTVIPSAGDVGSLMEVLPIAGQKAGQEVRAQARAYLKRTAKKLRRDGLTEVEEHVLQGHPAVAIIDYARSIPDNIVIMGSHGRSGIGRWPLGSIADLIARNCGDPVLVIHTSSPGAG